MISGACWYADALARIGRGCAVATKTVAALVLFGPAVALATGTARILYFEPLHSTEISTEAARKPSSTIEALQFDAYGKRFALSLQTNDRLSALQQKPGASSSLQLYRGHIDGMPQSWVRLTIIRGELHGMFWDGTELYAIEPIAQIRDALLTKTDATNGTAIFRLADVILEPGTASCGTDTSDTARRGTEAYDSLVKELKGSPAIMQAVGATRRLEISVLGDALFLGRYTTEADAREQILARLNNVDGIYSSQLGIEIAVPSVDLNDATSDPLSDTNSPNNLLSELSDLRKRSPGLYSRGLTHLFTGRELDGTTVGIAYVDALCSRQFGVGLTESNGMGPWIESLIAAHEIGHNFGAVHDGSDECESTPTGKFLMSPSVNGNDQFSACSLGLMRPNAAAASCITALPAPDLMISADLGVTNGSVARSFTWDLTVPNIGGVEAQDVRAEILVPPVVSIEEASVVGGSCTSGAGVIVCDMGTIAGGESRAVHLQLRSDVAGSNSISARVSARSESRVDNNQGDGSLVIEPEADLSLELQAPSTATVGNSFNLGVTVKNLSDIDASAIEVAFDLPVDVGITQATLGGVGCSMQGTAVRCTLPSLAPGATVTGSISLSLSNAGSAVLRGTVSGAYVDPTTTNDSAEVTVSVGAATATASASSGSGGGGAFGWPFLFGLLGLMLQKRRRGHPPSP